MSAARRRKGKPKKPLGPRKALEAKALRLGAKIMAKQRKKAGEHSGPAVAFDDATGWADVPRYTSPKLESKRRFV